MMMNVSVSHVLWDCPVYSTLRNDFLCKLQELLGDMGLKILRAWIVLKKHLLFWVVSCGRMTSALCLILLRITSLMFGSYGRLGSMAKISAFHSPNVRMHPGNWGMLGAAVG